MVGDRAHDLCLCVCFFEIFLYGVSSSSVGLRACCERTLRRRERRPVSVYLVADRRAYTLAVRARQNCVTGRSAFDTSGSFRRVRARILVRQSSELSRFPRVLARRAVVFPKRQFSKNYAKTTDTNTNLSSVARDFRPTVVGVQSGEIYTWSELVRTAICSKRKNP